MYKVKGSSDGTILPVGTETSLRAARKLARAWRASLPSAGRVAIEKDGNEIEVWHWSRELGRWYKEAI